MGRRFAHVLSLLAGLTLMAGFAAAALYSQTPATAAAQPDMMQLTAEAQTWLTDLIRINTTNPPGNEQAAAKYIQDVLQKENIPAEVLEMTPGRGYRGRAPAGRAFAGLLEGPSVARTFGRGGRGQSQVERGPLRRHAKGRLPSTAGARSTIRAWSRQIWRRLSS